MLNEGFGIMPIIILKNKELSDKQKLLFVYITSLCAKEGFCWASNEYLGEFFGVSGGTISVNLSQLKKLGFIDIEILEHYKRKITLSKNQQGVIEKSIGGGNEKSIDNNIIYNNIKEKGNFSEKVIELIKELDIKKKKKIRSFSDKSLDLWIRNLKEYGQIEEGMVKVLENSISNGYEGIFPLKGQDKPIKSKTDEERGKIFIKDKLNGDSVKHYKEELGEERYQKIFAIWRNYKNEQEKTTLNLKYYS